MSTDYDYHMSSRNPPKGLRVDRDGRGYFDFAVELASWHGQVAPREKPPMPGAVYHPAMPPSPGRPATPPFWTVSLYNLMDLLKAADRSRSDAVVVKFSSDEPAHEGRPFLVVYDARIEKDSEAYWRARAEALAVESLNMKSSSRAPRSPPGWTTA